MAKFVTGDELEKVITDIIWDAEQVLLIASPFIKLDEYFKKLFLNHRHNPKLHLIVLFGKNEENVSKSMSKADFDFFKNFLNVSIIYVPNLHAKYFGNENKGVITSINLYDFSFKNNIEFGVYSEQKLLSTSSNKTDKDAWNTCWEIADNNEAVYIKRPIYEKKLLSALLGKNYIKSEELHDVTEKFYGFNRTKNEIKKLSDFPDEKILGEGSGVKPTRSEIEKTNKGYCIRTGVEIPFNPKRPLSEIAYRSWAQFGNPDYPEKYCHKTGKLSNGRTSLNKPIL